MKFTIPAFLILLAGCSPSVMQIGKINMISNRNVETSFDYSLISSYAGGSERELKKSRAENIEQAIDQTVRKVPGGEFVMNASIYMIDEQYFAVEGDVWGRKGNVSYRGFAVGDRVTFKRVGQIVYGVVTGLKDDLTCYVKLDGDAGGLEVRYDILAKGDTSAP
ncbi:MAG: hypothetical protein EXR69_09765 [Myxococcales bacterium]|nr:hypothetical protein [Myxococcales bacterium]